MSGQVAAVEMGYDIIKSSVAQLQEGDIYYTGPTSTVGVRAASAPDSLRRRLKAKTSRGTIFQYQWIGELTGIEKVNVKLLCYVQYNGPEVECTFHIPADGNRARLNNDVHIKIDNPLSLETMETGENWQNLGVYLFPVVKIPVSIFVDRPWPRSNYKESFMLVLSGMHGFGTGASGSTYDDYMSWED